MKGVSAIIQRLMEEGVSEEKIVERLREYGYAESYVRKKLSTYRKRPSERFLTYVLSQVRSLPDELPKRELENFLKRADSKSARAILGFVRTAKSYYRSKATIKRLTGIDL